MPRLRCKRCGALNSIDATWCGQCYGRFKPARDRRETKASRWRKASSHTDSGQSSFVSPSIYDGIASSRLRSNASVYSTVKDRISSSLFSYVLDLKCPHCESGFVEGAVKLWVIRGFVLFHRFGSRYEVGCSRCLSKRVRLNLLGNLLLGVWGFPWGLATPLVLVQNLIAAASSSESRRRQLQWLLEAIGITEPLGIDELARLLDLLVATASGVAWADGSVDSSELDLAVEIIERFSEHLLEPSKIRSWVASQYKAVVPPASVSPDLRKVALRCGALIAAANGNLTDAEEKAIYAYGGWLGLSESESRTIVREISHIVAGLTQKEKDEFERACRILGVDRDVGPIALKQRYRQLMMEVHPDVIGPAADTTEANRRAAEINWAYDFLSRHIG